MPAPKRRSSGPFSWSRPLQPRCRNAMAVVNPAKPAPAISACCVFPPRLFTFAIVITATTRLSKYPIEDGIRLVAADADAYLEVYLFVLPDEGLQIRRSADDPFLLRGIYPELALLRRHIGLPLAEPHFFDHRRRDLGIRRNRLSRDRRVRIDIVDRAVDRANEPFHQILV